MRVNRFAGFILVALLAAAPASAHAASSVSPRCLSASIQVAPHEITAGDPVTVFGRLRCRTAANQPVILFHHLVGGPPGYQPVSITRTDSLGFYAFNRADGVVMTDRGWYVRALRNVRSRAVSIKVAAQVTLAGPSATELTTGTPYTFTGTVTPFDIGAAVVLERQNAANGNGWVRIGSGVVGAGGAYTIDHTFVVAGDANIRTLVRSFGRNIPSPSNVLAYSISQAQNPKLTISSAADPIVFGGSTVIGGTLAAGAGDPVTLLSRTAHSTFQPIAQMLTGTGGAYSFAAQSPVHSTYYEVTSRQSTGTERSAVLFEGIQDVVNASASATTVAAGQTLTFAGTVAPDHTGHIIYLQRADASDPSLFHVVEVGVVQAGSTFSITHRFYDAGTTSSYRVYVPGGPENEGAPSEAFDITVTAAAASTLPPESPSNSSGPSSVGS